MKFFLSHHLPSRFFFSLVTFAALLLASSPSISQAQPQVGSAENPRDCKGVDFGQNVRDTVGGCCLPSQIDCGRCLYTRSECERQFGCFTSVRNLGCGCGAPAPVCGKCGYTMTECERVLGCGTTAVNRGCGCGSANTKDSRGTCCAPSAQACGVCNYNWACPPQYGCGRQPNQCGDCSHQNTCCEAYHPGTTCFFYHGSLIYHYTEGKNTTTRDFSRYITIVEVNPGAYVGYFEWKVDHCFGSGTFMCARVRCTAGKCPPGNLGCFDPKSTILLEGGIFKRADEISVGDRIYNSLTGSSAAVKSVITGDEKIPMVEMGFGGNLLRVTQDHPVLTRDGFKRARDIVVGDIVLDASGHENAVEYTRLAELIPGQRVFNFELDVDSEEPLKRVIVADNIVSGDLTIQNSVLPGEE